MRFVKTCVSTKVADSGLVLSHIVVCYIVVYYVKSAWTLDRLGVSRPARVTIAVYEVEFVTNSTRRVAKPARVGSRYPSPYGRSAARGARLWDPCPKALASSVASRHRAHEGLALRVPIEDKGAPQWGIERGGVETPCNEPDILSNAGRITHGDKPLGHLADAVNESVSDIGELSSGIPTPSSPTYFGTLPWGCDNCRPTICSPWCHRVPRSFLHDYWRLAGSEHGHPNLDAAAHAGYRATDSEPQAAGRTSVPDGRTRVPDAGWDGAALRARDEGWTGEMVGVGDDSEWGGIPTVRLLVAAVA